MKMFGIALLCSAMLLPALYGAQNPAPTISGNSPQAKAPAASANDQSKAEETVNDIRIGAGDLLQINVFGAPDLSQEVRVSSSGKIFLPLVEGIDVGGLTNDQAQAVVEKKLRDAGLLKDPHVTIFTKEYATQGITVLGEVSRPGIYPLLGTRRLFDVISVAGGETDRAGKRITITHRDDPQNPINVEVTSDPTQSLASNIEVYPGDTVVVSRAGVVYVVGEVKKPSGFTMDNDENLTVLQAISLAGGISPTAALNDARIIRKNSSGRLEIPVPLKEIMAARHEDVPLQAEDILFIPNSKAKSVARRGLESILQVTTGLAIYRR